MRRTILVVDDEEIIVEYAVTVLLAAGEHDVVGAQAAEKALEIARARRIDLVLSDIRMPGMDGFELVRALRRLCPWTQIVFMTGFDVPEARIEASGLGSVAFLQKPFRADRLVETVEEAFQIDDETRSLPLRPGGSGQRARSGVSLQGRLEHFPLGEILQMCCMARRTGRIVVLRGAERGEVYVADGRIVHARSEGRAGRDVLFDLYGWDRGALIMEDGVASPAETIEIGWEHLLMEAARRDDEARSVPA